MAADAMAGMGADGAPAFPMKFGVELSKVCDLAHGENAHQAAALYAVSDACSPTGPFRCTVAGAKRLTGRKPGVDGLLAASAAWRAVCSFADAAVVVVQGGAVRSAAASTNVVAACEGAFGCCDPELAKGTVVAVNRQVVPAFVDRLVALDPSVEMVVAPSYRPDAVLKLGTRRGVCVLETGGLRDPRACEAIAVDGGAIVQERDCANGDAAGLGCPAGMAALECPTGRKPNEGELPDLAFAWNVAAAVPSHAAAVCRDRLVVGLEAGAPSCLDAVLAACARAREACARLGAACEGLACAVDTAVTSSEAVDALADAGVACIVQPGGSARDAETVRACDERGIAMLLAGRTSLRR